MAEELFTMPQPRNQFVMPINTEALPAWEETKPLEEESLPSWEETKPLEETPARSTSLSDIVPIPAFAPETPEQNKEKWINRAKNVAGTAILGPIAPSVMPWLNVISGSTKLTKEDLLKPDERAPKFAESKQPTTMLEKVNPLYHIAKPFLGEKGSTAFNRELMDMPGEIGEFITSPGGKAATALGALPVTRPLVTGAFLADTVKGAIDQAKTSGENWDSMSDEEKGKTIGQMVKSTLLSGVLAKVLPGQVKGALPKRVPPVIEPTKPTMATEPAVPLEQKPITPEEAGLPPAGTPVEPAPFIEQAKAEALDKTEPTRAQVATLPLASAEVAKVGKPEAPKLTEAEKATIQSELAELQPEEKTQQPIEKEIKNELSNKKQSIRPELQTPEDFTGDEIQKLANRDLGNLDERSNSSFSFDISGWTRSAKSEANGIPDTFVFSPEGTDKVIIEFPAGTRPKDAITSLVEAIKQGDGPGQDWLPINQSDAIRNAIREGKPVLSESVEKHGIKLPKTYVKQGDLYIKQKKGAPNATEIRQVQESIQPERERANAQRLSAETSPSDSLQQAAGTQKVQAPRTEARQAGVLLKSEPKDITDARKLVSEYELELQNEKKLENRFNYLSKKKNLTQAEELELEKISDQQELKQEEGAGVSEGLAEEAYNDAKLKIASFEKENSSQISKEPLPPQMPAGPGAKTANVPEPDAKSQIEQLTDAFKGIDAKKIPLTQKMQEAFNIGSAKNAVQEGVAKAVSGLKATGDFLINKWRGIQTIDDLLRAKGDLSKSINERGWRVRKWEKEAKRAVPSKRWQAAIAKYIDAGGNMDKLQQGAAETKPEYRQAYLDAMNLPPDYKVAAENARNYFESRLDEAIEAGVLKDGVEDYIHRLYESRPDQANRAFAIVQQGLLSKNPALAKQRVFDFDWEAEKLGYRPVQSFITRISQYESSLSKAIAAREFIKKATELKASDGRPVIDVKGVGIPITDPEGVRQATLIKPQFNPAKANEVGTQNYRGDYVNKEFPALSKWKWVGTDAAGKPIMVQGDVAIHPEFVGRINALLEPSRVKYGRWSKYTNPMLQAGSAFKQTMLDLSGFHQVQIAVHALEHKVVPWKIIQDIDFTNPKVEGLLKGGITLGGDYHVSEGLIGSSLTRKIPMLGPLMETYHQYLFQDFIPRVKMTMALNALERNIARYKGKMTDEQIYHKTAYQANAAFGELNYIMLERSKTAQDIARLIMLAPDFLEARARFALEGFEKGGKSKVPGFGNEQRAALLLGALTMYFLARVMNKTLDDQYHLELENAFSVVAGKHAYSLRTVQGDILHLLDKPVQFWLNRLNPLYGRTALEMATGRDYFGRQRTRLEILWDSAKNIMPISLRHGPEQSIWESLGKSFGLNARRYTATDDAFKLAKKWKDANGIGERGEFIYDSEKDPLRPLKLALSHDDEGKAAAEIKTLLESKKYTRNRLDEYFKRYASMPFTGSKANDIKWKKTLSEDERKTVEAAMQYKHEILKMYRQAFAKYYVAMKTPATP